MNWAQSTLQPLLFDAPLQKFLVVEGEDDQFFYQRWLERIDRGAAGKIQVEQPGSKAKVLDALDWLQTSGGNPANVVGVVDRDEWTKKDIQQMQAKLRQLRVNSQRHTLESYFTDPDEIQAALFARDQLKYKAPVENLRNAVAAARKEWVEHWALWSTLQRVWVRLNLDEQFPKSILDRCPVPTEGQIEKQLREWAKILNVKDLMTSFKDERDKAFGKTHSIQVRSCVHGKNFFNQVVKSRLCQCDPAVKVDSWMAQLIAWSPKVPTDLENLLKDLLV
jgi:hypothetical protein